MLISGIRSVATEWIGFEYDKNNLGVEPDNKKFPEYKPVGMIAQLSALRQDYKSKNMAGGT